MRLFLLVLIALFCQNLHAQVLPRMARLEGFNPYRPVAGRLEFFPDAVHPESVREYDSTGKCVRHAQVIMKDGHWYIHGIDSVWGWYSLAVFTVEENIPEGPFAYTYNKDLGEEVIYYEYTGEYRNGLLHGKMRDKNGSVFQYENGILHGNYIYEDLWNYHREKGRFENGRRQGKVVISNKGTKVNTLHYTRGYLSRVEFHYSKRDYIGDYYHLTYSHFDVFADTLTNTLEIIKYGTHQDTLEIQQQFAPADIRSSQVYEYREVFSWEFQHTTEKPQRLRMERNEPSYEFPPGTFSKRINNFYADGSFEDSSYWWNSQALNYYSDRKQNLYDYNLEGVLFRIRYGYQTHHNPVTCYYGIKDLLGEWVLEPEYEEIIMADPNGFILKKEGRYGLAGWNGELLIAPVLEELENANRYRSNVPLENFQAYFQPLDPGKYLARTGGKWGLMDKRGNWLVPAEYDEISCMDSFVVVRKGKDYYIWKQAADRFILYDQPFENIASSRIPFFVKLEQKAGILGRDLKWIVPPEYDHLEGQQGCYVAGIRIGPKLTHYWVLDKDGERTHPEPLTARPILHPKFIETVGADFLRGIMSYEGNILAQPEYSRVDLVFLEARDETCFMRLYHAQQSGKHYLVDTTGKRSESFETLRLIGPYTENVSYWGTIYASCPKAFAFVVTNEKHYRIIDHRGATLLDETMLKEKIDTIWVIGTIAFVSTPTRLYCYFSDNGTLFKHTPAKTAELFYYSGVLARENECIVKYKDHRYGLVDSRTGTVLLKPEYQSIEKRGEEYVLRDGKGKISFYKRGEDNSWQEKYTLRYPVNTANYIVYTHTGKAGLIYVNGDLVIDTLYKGMAYQTSGNGTWYWAEKEQGIWDVYGSGGNLLYGDIHAESGSLLDNGELMITLKNGKKVLLNPKKEELIKADRILAKERDLKEFLFMEAKLWGRYNRDGHFSHPARYEKISPGWPFFVMHHGKPGQLDSAGTLVAPLDTFSFLKTPLPKAGHRYHSFSRGADFDKGNSVVFPIDSLPLWQGNLLFLIRSPAHMIDNYSGEQPQAYGFTRVLITGETKSIDPTLYFLDYRDNGNRYFHNGYVSLSSANLLSTFIVTQNMGGNGQKYVQTHTYYYTGAVLKKLQIADLVIDEKALELLFLKGLAEKNLPVEVCPDLKFVYEMSKHRFYLDETGVAFFIEVGYEEEYLQVKILYSDMKDILKKDGPVYSVASPN